MTVTFYAVLGVQLLGGLYTDEPGLSASGAFDASASAATALAVLITTENYPEVFRPALHKAPPALAVPFFFSFMFLALLLMGLLLSGISLVPPTPPTP